MNALLNGFESSEATFRSLAVVETGRAVALQSTNEVYYPMGSKDFTGIVNSYNDGIVSVVMKGYAVARFKDTIPTIGICKLAPSSSGYMEVDEDSGKPYTVVGVDITNKTLEFIL